MDTSQSTYSLGEAVFYHRVFVATDAAKCQNSSIDIDKKRAETECF